MASFGETLKRERELREISLRQIAEATKINIRYLEALEENRFDALPGGLFNKGFIRAYSTFIGVDGEAMVNSYLQQIGPQIAGPAVPRPDLGQRTMHRPAGVPQKRAGARPADPSSSQRPARPAITFASTSAPAVAATAPSAAAPAVEARADRAPAPAPHSTPADPVRAALLAIASDRTEKKPERAGERSSRALFWILSLVAAAGVLFLPLLALETCCT